MSRGMHQCHSGSEVLEVGDRAAVQTPACREASLGISGLLPVMYTPPGVLQLLQGCNAETWVMAATRQPQFVPK